MAVKKEDTDLERLRPADMKDAYRLAEIEIFNYRLNFYPIFQTDRYFFSELSVHIVTEEYLEEPERISRTTVYDDGVVKGFIRVKEDEIEKLFVEPVFQREGIGGLLLQFAVEQLGAKRLEVLEKNDRAIRFYQRHGFTLTERKQQVDDTPEFLIWMERHSEE